jgi:hypothetical protein
METAWGPGGDGVDKCLPAVEPVIIEDLRTGQLGVRVALIGLAATRRLLGGQLSGIYVHISGAPGSLVGTLLVTSESVLAVGSVQPWREQSRARREM